MQSERRNSFPAVHARAGEIADDGAGALSQAQNHNDAAGLVFAEKAPSLATDDHNGELITIGLHMDAGPITGVPLDIELAAPHGIARRITDAAADNDPPAFRVSPTASWAFPHTSMLAPFK